MESRKVTKEFRMAQWMQAFRERSESGESVKEFCSRHGINRSAYFYWQRKAREAACSQLACPADDAATTFAEVVVLPAQPSETKEKGRGQVRLEAAGAVITADCSYPADKLASLLRELVRPC
jgi:transposase-like protein